MNRVLEVLLFIFVLPIAVVVIGYALYELLSQFTIVGGCPC